MILQIHPKAEHELKAAARWYEQQREGLESSSLPPLMPRWRESRPTRIERPDWKPGVARETFDEWFCHDFRT